MTRRLLLPILCLLLMPLLAASGKRSVAFLSSENPEILRARLLTIADRYASLHEVPYVYGGGNISDLPTCQACQACVAVNKIGPEGRARFRKCEACRSCGIDCSHLMHLIFTEAGLPFPYRNTVLLHSRLDSRRFTPDVPFINLGRRLSDALPGDLLLYPNHIVMLTAHTRGGRGDIVHATRLETRALGGILQERDVNLLRMRGPLLKILRHRSLYTPSITLPEPMEKPLILISRGDFAWMPNL
jgi:hypothetical protein